MEFLQAYLGALGGTATLLLLIGFFGKSIMEQWLKRNYKAWELEAEKPYEEDFLRLDKKLDAIAAQDKTRFDYHFPKAADAAEQIVKLCNSLRQGLKNYVQCVDWADKHKKSKAKEVGEQVRFQLSPEYWNVSAAHHANRHHFSEEFNTLVEEFLYFTFDMVLMPLPSEMPDTSFDADAIRSSVERCYSAIELDYRRFVGNEPKEKEPTGVTP